MTSYWSRPDSLIAVEPGDRDVCVVTIVNGTRVAVQPVAAYEQARVAAQAIARDTKRPVKLLPMAAGELVAFMGLRPADVAQSSPAEREADRQLVLATCMSVLRECNDAAIRAEALDLLTGMAATRQ